MRLLAIYSPEYPCLLKGLARYRPRLASVFRGNMIRQLFVFNTPQYREYDQRDRPVYGEIGHGPWCSGLPYPKVPIDPHPLDNGTDMDENPPTSTLPGTAPSRATTGSGYAGTPGEQAIMNAMLAGRPAGRPTASAPRLPDVRIRRPRAGGRLMSRNSTTTAAAVKLGIFTICSVLVTGLLAAIMGNIGFGGGKEYKAVFSHRLDAAEGRRRPDRGRQRRRGARGRALRPHPGAGHLPDQGRDRADHGRRAPRSASSTWSATATSPSSRARQRRRDPRGRRHDPDRPDQPGARPDRPVQRLPAAVPGAQPPAGQRPEPEPRPGPAGRGRHRRRPGAEDRLADQLAGRPRPAHRRGDHQPQPDPGHRRPAARAAERPDRRAEGLDDRPGP